MSGLDLISPCGAAVDRGLDDALTQSLDELAAVTRERDALKAALVKAAVDLRKCSSVFAEYETHRSAFSAGCMARDAEEVVKALERGDLRKP